MLSTEILHRFHFRRSRRKGSVSSRKSNGGDTWKSSVTATRTSGARWRSGGGRSSRRTRSGARPCSRRTKSGRSGSIRSAGNRSEAAADGKTRVQGLRASGSRCSATIELSALNVFGSFLKILIIYFIKTMITMKILETNINAKVNLFK